MKKISWLLLACAAVIALPLFAQQISEESVVVNIEVPVRVFQGRNFIDNLSISDFELFEDGVPQNIEAVYLVKNRSIERSEEKKRFVPNTARNFYLFFEISDYSSKLGDAVSHFVHNVVYPGDDLTIITPVKTYRLRGKALEVRSRDQIANQLKGILRQDAMYGNSEYRETIRDLTALAQAMAASFSQDETLRVRGSIDSSDPNQDQTLEDQLSRYEELLMRIEGLRTIDQKKLLDFAGYLQSEEGQKYVFLFYQKEYLPQIEPRILDQYMTVYQDMPNIQQTISNVFDFYLRDIPFNVEMVKQAYADASIAIHFLFISSPSPHVFGVRFQEKSEDIFSAFQQMASATGGFIDSSANPDYLFQQAVESSENYYLVYYSPKNLVRDGKFKNIRVRVKDKNMKVVHRLGYFSD